MHLLKWTGTAVCLLILSFLLCLPATAELPHNITTSKVPGELWILFGGLLHSTDYGCTFENLREGGVVYTSDINYQKVQECLTFYSDGYGELSFSHDKGITIDETWTPSYPYFGPYNWMPDTSAWIPINENSDLSFDSMQTITTDVWLNMSNQIGAGGPNALGWSPNDILFKTVLGPDQDMVFGFSCDMGKHFEIRSQIPYGASISNNGFLFTGPSPGEVYIVHGYFHFFYVSQDTMRTWEEGPTFLPPGELNYTFWEFERGWTPGEIYWYCWGGNARDGPLAVLFRSTDFCHTWEEVYKNRDYYISDVDDTSTTLPSRRFNVWPNPTNGSIHFQVKSSGRACYFLFDLTGRNVMQGTIYTGTVHSLDLHYLASGYYVLRIIPLAVGGGRKTLYKRIVLVK